MRCEFCSGQTKSKWVTMQHRLGRRLYVVENVPAQVCPECGERYFHARTLDAVDALLRGKHHVKRRLKVEVVALD